MLPKLAAIMILVGATPCLAVDSKPPEKHPWLVMGEKIDAQIAEWTRLKKEDAQKAPSPLHMLKVAAQIAEEGYLLQAKEIAELAGDKEPERAAKLIAALVESTVLWGVWRFRREEGAGYVINAFPGKTTWRPVPTKPGVYEESGSGHVLTVRGFSARLVLPGGAELKGTRIK